MLFWAYMGKMQLKWLLLAILGSCLGVFGQTDSPRPHPLPQSNPSQKIWMQVDETIVPLRENISRNGAIVGFARKGQVLAVEKSTEHWVKVRVNDTLVGWAPGTAFSASGPPVNWNPDKVKGIFMLILGIGIGAFLFLALSLQIKRKTDSQARANQALLDAKRRLQNKIQVLFRHEPRMHSQLAMGEIDLLEYLRGIGFVANLESDVEKFQVACKAFKPNLILAEAELLSDIEAFMHTDAHLINTPIIYLHCDSTPPKTTNGIRAYLETPATDKELADTITLCLKKSPDKIHFSVQPMALRGGIHAGTLLELLHFLASLKKTGKLLVREDAFQGEVHFLLGNITQSQTLENNGEKAVQEILDRISGTFEFYEKEPVADGNAGMNTEKILMDWARIKDESKHHTRT